jgi:hypothetical protein
MKVYGRVGVYILNLCTKERWVVRLLFPWGEGPKYPLDRRMGGPQLIWCCGEEKNLYLCQELNPDSWAIKPLTIYLFFHLVINILSNCLFRYLSIYVWYSHNELFMYSFNYCLLCHDINIRPCIHYQKEVNCYFQTRDFYHPSLTSWIE